MSALGGGVSGPSRSGLGGYQGVGGYYGGGGSASAGGAESALMAALSGLGGGGGSGGHSSMDIGQVGPSVSGGGSMGSTGTIGKTGTLGATGTMGAGGASFSPYYGSAGLPASLTNTAKTPADVQWLIDQVKSRTGPGVTGEAIDIAGSKIRDAGSGLSKALSAQQAARGVLGTGAAAQQQGKLASDLQRQIAGSASDISLGRQHDIDQLLLGSQGIMEAPSRIGQADRSLGLQQYLGQAGLDLQKYGIDKNALMQQNAQNFSQQSQLLSLLMNLY